MCTEKQRLIVLYLGKPPGKDERELASALLAGGQFLEPKKYDPLTLGARERMALVLVYYIRDYTFGGQTY